MKTGAFVFIIAFAVLKYIALSHISYCLCEMERIKKWLGRCDMENVGVLCTM